MHPGKARWKKQERLIPVNNTTDLMEVGVVNRRVS